MTKTNSKNWLPLVLMVAGGINLVLILFSWLIFSKLMVVYQELPSNNVSVTMSFLTSLVSAFVALLQFGYGLYWQRQERKGLAISRGWQVMGIILLVMGTSLFLCFGLPRIILGFAFPLYNLSGSF